MASCQPSHAVLCCINAVNVNTDILRPYCFSPRPPWLNNHRHGKTPLQLPNFDSHGTLG